MHYVYVLRSQKDGKFYVGYTQNLRKRLVEHNRGHVQSTQHRTPFELVYYEACRAQTDALGREKYLKTAYGKRYLKARMKDDLAV